MIKLEIYLFLSIKCRRIVGRLAAGKIGHECEIRENVTGMRVFLSVSLRLKKLTAVMIMIVIERFVCWSLSSSIRETDIPSIRWFHLLHNALQFADISPATSRSSYIWLDLDFRSSSDLFYAMILPLFNKFEASKSQRVESFSAITPNLWQQKRWFSWCLL